MDRLKTFESPVSLRSVGTFAPVSENGSTHQAQAAQNQLRNPQPRLQTSAASAMRYIGEGVHAQKLATLQDLQRIVNPRQEASTSAFGVRNDKGISNSERRKQQIMQQIVILQEQLQSMENGAPDNTEAKMRISQESFQAPYVLSSNNSNSNRGLLAENYFLYSPKSKTGSDNNPSLVRLYSQPEMHYDVHKLERQLSAQSLKIKQLSAQKSLLKDELKAKLTNSTAPLPTQQQRRLKKVKQASLFMRKPKSPRQGTASAEISSQNSSLLTVSQDESTNLHQKNIPKTQIQGRARGYKKSSTSKQQSTTSARVHSQQQSKNSTVHSQLSTLQQEKIELLQQTQQLQLQVHQLEIQVLEEGQQLQAAQTVLYERDSQLVAQREEFESLQAQLQQALDRAYEEKCALLESHTEEIELLGSKVHDLNALRTLDAKRIEQLQRDKEQLQREIRDLIQEIGGNTGTNFTMGTASQSILVQSSIMAPSPLNSAFTTSEQNSTIQPSARTDSSLQNSHQRSYVEYEFLNIIKQFKHENDNLTEQLKKNLKRTIDLEKQLEAQRNAASLMGTPLAGSAGKSTLPLTQQQIQPQHQKQQQQSPAELKNKTEKLLKSIQRENDKLKEQLDKNAAGARRDAKKQPAPNRGANK